MGPTRARDLLAVGLLAAVAGYALVRFNYSRMPALPRLAGLPAALIGLAEAIAGLGLRARIQDGAHALGDRPRRPPVPPLVAARAVMAAKASALAGIALCGLWVGLGAYVIPSASTVLVAGTDTVTAVIGLISALVMVGGALWLEYCCRAPGDRQGPGATA